MQTEEDPLFQELSLRTLITWTRWWHLTAKALVLVLKKKVWGTVGSFLKEEKANHLNSDDVPSDEEGEKEAKRQKSEPTTPLSTSSRPPN